MRRYDIDSIDNRDPAMIEGLLRWLHPLLLRYFRAEVRGLDRIPGGAGLYVGNHSSGMLTPDSFIFCGEVYKRRGIDQVPYGLGHEVAITLPLIHQFIVPLGAVRASHDTARRLFDAGKKVIVYPGGDVDAMRPFLERDQVMFGGRQGYVRLAIREGVPIIPVISAGAHETFMILDDANWLSAIPGLDRLLRVKVWPTTLSIPWGLTPGPPPVYIPFPTKILIEVQEPLTFDRAGEDAAADDSYVQQCDERTLGVMQAALTRLADERRRMASLDRGDQPTA